MVSRVTIHIIDIIHMFTLICDQHVYVASKAVLA